MTTKLGHLLTSCLAKVPDILIFCVRMWAVITRDLSKI